MLLEAEMFYDKDPTYGTGDNILGEGRIHLSKKEKKSPKEWTSSSGACEGHEDGDLGSIRFRLGECWVLLCGNASLFLVYP